MDISQLLLSGAKMTSQHCEACGYPLFEKGGKIICANCTEAEEKPESQGVLHETRAELYAQLKETKDLNEVEHILRCLTLLKELM